MRYKDDSNDTVEKLIREYPFLNYIHEDKGRYKHAKDMGYNDPNDLFLIGDSGGFLLNINDGDKFVNTHLLTESADFYRQNKQYTFYKEDSIPHRQFRKREEYRRKHGYTAPCFVRNGHTVNVHISGDMYNYLNYTMIKQLDKSSAKSTNIANTGSKKYDFPLFIDAQFYTFAVIEFARLNGFHLIIDKTRRGGFSYIMSSRSANRINLQPRAVVIHVAADKKYLTKTGGLTDFSLDDLRFYETRTPFKRGVLSTDKENFTLGFKMPNGIVSPKSWNSSLFSVSAMNNPDCAIGKDAVDVEVEELSTMENFDEFMSVTEPAMRTGSYTTGMLIAWGTATSGNMQVFESNFYNPRAYHFMPFENVWDKDSRDEVCGYFKPYAWGLQGQIGDQFAMDEDGNSNLEIGLKIAHNERQEQKKNAKTFSEYINYLGQYALTPSESFSSTTENMFSSEELLEWEERLRTDNAFKFYTDGMLFEDPKNPTKVIFKPNARIEAEGGKHNVDFFDYIEGVPIKSHEHHHGCMRMWFAPMQVKYTDSNGNRVVGPPPGLYSMSYDPVGVSKDQKQITNKNSHNSIKVWMNPHPLNNFKPKLCMSYYGRPNKLEEADRMFYNMARFYNCIGTAGVEVNRGDTVANFTKWHALKYLMKDPVDIWDTSIKGKATANYGVNMGDTKRKLDGLQFLQEMLYSTIGKDELGRDIKFFQCIYDYQSILELKKWNAVGNFDRVSEMIIYALQWRQRNIDAAKQLANRKKIEDVANKDSIFNRDWF